MDLKVYTIFVRRWAWLIGLVGAVTAIIGLLYSLQETTLYSSTTTLLVSQSGPARTSLDFDTLRTRERIAKTYAQLLVQRSVLEAAIAEAKADIGPGLLASRISVSLIQDTELMKLTVSDTDPNRAAQLANAIARVFPSIEGQILGSTFATGRQTLYVAEEARPNLIPVSPNIPRNLILSAVVGMLLAVAVGFLYDYFNDRVSSAAMVEKLTGVATIAAIGKITGADPAEQLVVPGKTALPVAEAYRMVRSHVAGLVNGKPVRSLAVVSSAPQEGRSLTAVNLAVAMAQTGKRVLLIDADLRKPALHRFFRRTNTRGLTTALLRHGGDQLADHVTQTDIDQLTLLSAGPLLPNAISYLGSSQMEQLVAQCIAAYDLVIFDTPALLSVVDGQLIAGMSDAAIVVVRAGVTRDTQLKKAVGDLVDANITILGAVLNDAPLASSLAEYYNGVGVDESIEVIDFTRAVGDRDGRAGRKTEK